MIYSSRPTEPGDVASLDIHDWDIYGKTVQPYFDQRLGDLRAYTLVADGEPFAVLCGWEVAPGTFELAMFSDQSIKQHARAFFHLATDLLEQLEAEGVRRWQTYVQCKNAISADMNERLGFTVDAILEKYYPDDDAYLLSRVRA